MISSCGFFSPSTFLEWALVLLFFTFGLSLTLYAYFYVRSKYIKLEGKFPMVNLIYWNISCDVVIAFGYYVVIFSSNETYQAIVTLGTQLFQLYSLVITAVIVASTLMITKVKLQWYHENYKIWLRNMIIFTTFQVIFGYVISGVLFPSSFIVTLIFVAIWPLTLVIFIIYTNLRVVYLVWKMNLKLVEKGPIYLSLVMLFFWMQGIFVVGYLISTCTMTFFLDSVERFMGIIFGYVNLIAYYIKVDNVMLKEPDLSRKNTVEISQGHFPSIVNMPTDSKGSLLSA